MSRSRKKRAITGITTAKTEKWAKRFAWRRFRRATHVAIADNNRYLWADGPGYEYKDGAAYREEPPFSIRQVYDAAYNGPKDGKCDWEYPPHRIWQYPWNKETYQDHEEFLRRVRRK